MITTTLPFSLRQLQYAVAVAEGLSFRKAATRCGVSQPSLSAQIAQLEGALGVVLFERDRRRVLVTTAGRDLLERARVILRESQELADFARRAGDPFGGALRLGVIPTVSPYFLPRAAQTLHLAHPRLSVRWVEDKTASLVRRLDEASLDAAIVALEADLGDVEHAVLGSDPFVLVTAVGHPLGKRRAPASPSELRGASVLLLDEGHCFREQALSYCASARAEELEFRATSLTTLTQMVATGVGVTLLPRLAVATENAHAALTVREFAAPAPRRTIALVWRKRASLGAALMTLAGTLRGAWDAPRAAG